MKISFEEFAKQKDMTQEVKIEFCQFITWISHYKFTLEQWDEFWEIFNQGHE